MTRSSLYVLLLTTLFACAIACDRPAAAPPDVAGGDDAGSTARPGPQRIVSLAPSVTETLFALGAGERVVGVTRFCDYPAATESLPKVGGLTDVDVETVLSLEPDLVVGVTSKTGSGLQRTLDAADVETLFLPVETFADVQASMRTLGARLGLSERGEALAAAIGEANAEVGDDAPTVLVLFGRDPWIAAGPNTFADEMIRRAGGRNALADLDAPYPTLDAERMGALRPDLILDTSWGAGSDAPLPVGDPDAVIRIDPALIRPGPRLIDAMKLFRRAILTQERAASQSAR